MPVKPWTCYWHTGEAIHLLTVEEDIDMDEIAFVFAMLRIAYSQMAAER